MNELPKTKHVFVVAFLLFWILQCACHLKHNYPAFASKRCANTITEQNKFWWIGGIMGMNTLPHAFHEAMDLFIGETSKRSHVSNYHSALVKRDLIQFSLVQSHIVNHFVFWIRFISALCLFQIVTVSYTVRFSIGFVEKTKCSFSCLNLFLFHFFANIYENFFSHRIFGFSSKEIETVYCVMCIIKNNKA